MVKRAKYNVTDGKLVLTLHAEEKGYYYVTSPMDPEIHTQARSIEEAFYMARDARKCLDDWRREKLAEQKKADAAAAHAAKQKPSSRKPVTRRPASATVAATAR